MRLRTAQGRLKVEHSIIDGVREVLERLLAENLVTMSWIWASERSALPAQSPAATVNRRLARVSDRISPR